MIISFNVLQNDMCTHTQKQRIRPLDRDGYKNKKVSTGETGEINSDQLIHVRRSSIKTETRSRIIFTMHAL